MYARNSVHHKRNAPSLLFPRLQTTQPNICTNVHNLHDDVELQKHLNTCLRKVITRTLEHFLNIFEMFCRVFSSTPLSTVFHSAPIAKRCTSHVIIALGAKLHQYPVVLICKMLSSNKVQETSKVISKFALIGYEIGYEIGYISHVQRALMEYC